jgi:hypothetical protein
MAGRKTTDVSFLIRLSQSQVTEIERIAKNQANSKASIIRAAIDFFLKENSHARGSLAAGVPGFMDTFTEEDKAALVSAPAPADVPEEERARLEGEAELHMLFQDGRRLPAIRSKGKCQACGAGDGEFHADGCRNELCPKCKRKLDDCEHTMIERYVYKG